MTREQRQLLLKDLCGRLLYGVKVQTPLFESPTSIKGITEDECWVYSDEDNYEWVDIEEVKPYLRPLSSMTEEEKYTYRHMLGATLNSEGESIMFVYVEDFPTVIDWLLSKHFDYRGLIEKGLALEAPEDMYKIQ